MPVDEDIDHALTGIFSCIVSSITSCFSYLNPCARRRGDEGVDMIGRIDQMPSTEETQSPAPQRPTINGHTPYEQLPNGHTTHERVPNGHMNGLPNGHARHRAH